MFHVKQVRGDKLQDIETWKIKDHVLEFIPDIHQYLVDGICVSSITQILKIKFGNKYNCVPEEILKRASEKGTETHQAIEYFEKYKINDIGSVELRNYKFLKKAYKFKCLDNEVPVILFKDNKPVACGRIDLVLEENEETGLGDIKRTSVLDKEYLAYQLNLYRIAYQQCYDTEIKFLKGLHLRNDVRKYINIPINEKMAISLLNEYLEGSNYESKS